ncbi:MAG: hypothetical protein ACRCU3_06730 [Eubacteriaceae bacterium]
MEKYKKYIFIVLGLLVFVLVSPILIAWITMVLSPYITTIGVIILLLLGTAVIAWKNKIGRK